MSDKYELNVEVRTQLGKGANRRMRRLENQIPAVIYGTDKGPMSIMVNGHHLNNALKNNAFYSHILTLNVNGAAEKVILKALHRHPSKPQILHADFLRVSATEKLHMSIPFHFINEDIAPGVKTAGGVISHMMNEVEISCLPGDLPENIEVDLGNLEMNESIHLSQLKVPKGVEIVALLHNDDKAVVNIHEPRVIEEEPEEVAAPAEEGEAATEAGESEEGESEAPASE